MAKAQQLGISYEDALARKHDKDVKHHRQISKVANFGLPGGLGVRGLIGYAHGYGIKLDIMSYDSETNVDVARARAEKAIKGLLRER